MYKKRDYTVVRTIGKGSFGSVYLVKKNDERYAMKELRKNKAHQYGGAQRYYEIVMQEVEMINAFEPSGISTKLIEFTEDRQSYYIVMEYMNGGTMDDLIAMKEDKCLSEQEVREFFLKLAPGLKYLAKHNIMHRDIKPENFLFSIKEGHDL